MAKRKDNEDESQPPSKRLRPSLHVAAVPRNENRPGFRAACPRGASGASTSRNTSTASNSLDSTLRHSVSRITTLAFTASKNRLKAKHTQRSHTPAQPEPAEANLSDEAGLQPQHEAINAMPSTSDEAQLYPESHTNANTAPSASAEKLKRQRNNNTRVRNFVEAFFDLFS
jgi:hypothetical protein